MPVFAFCISDHPNQPDITVGYVRGQDVNGSLRLIADRRANILPLSDDFRWPAEAEGLDVYCVTDLAHRELNSLSAPEG